MPSTAWKPSRWPKSAPAGNHEKKTIDTNTKALRKEFRGVFVFSGGQSPDRLYASMAFPMRQGHEINLTLIEKHHIIIIKGPGVVTNF